jgi:plastocyanin
MIVAVFVVGTIVALSVASLAAGQSQSIAKASLLVRVNVSASNTKCVLSKKTAGRGLVIFRVKNVGTVGHAFQIKGRKTRVLSHGQSATLRVTFLRKGHYPYECTLNGHATAGMKGVFTIT